MNLLSQRCSRLLDVGGVEKAADHVAPHQLDAMGEPADAEQGVELGGLTLVGVGIAVVMRGGR